ncbi:Pyroglutamylated RFamide peptide receptor [Sciurus carolinensis]|uniref:Pyroglutamylated RFamide peptide receptor n=1 Tax=Sciurus carolinensis TaxID=30640 RepID=A0AA41NKC1_SCICA|nr:Pyroglutamylated RFamide peptide receptor [Sciurus carolinensis]
MQALKALNITPERFFQLLRDHNLTRQQFIALYGLQPLVYTPEMPASAKVALVLTGVLIFALALFGNALVICSKAMRTVTNIFICSRALSDLLIAFCIPVTMLQNISDNWLGDAFICKLLPFAQSTTMVMEILSMTCISVERHQGLVHPFKMKCQYTNQRALTMLGNFKKEYDDITIRMVFAIMQIIGFSNSICNSIIYAFMNENFKKILLSAFCYCLVK